MRYERGWVARMTAPALRHLIHRIRLAGYRRATPQAVMTGDPFRQIWVDPEAITTSLPDGALTSGTTRAPLRRGRFCRWRAIGLIEGGDWPLSAARYTPRQMLLYQALHQRYHGLCDWPETEFFASVRDRVAQGLRPWNGCRRLEDIHKRCRRADRLIASLKAEGFRESSDPVAICIGPEGQLIKSGSGQHRIMLGLIMGVQIPVLPIVRHRLWEDIRIGSSPARAELRAHPDLTGL